VQGGNWGGETQGNVTTVQYKSNQNCYYESLPNNKYILIKNYKKRNDAKEKEDVWQMCLK
jgi:hypothetical protein